MTTGNPDDERSRSARSSRRGSRLDTTVCRVFLLPQDKAVLTATIRLQFDRATTTRRDLHHDQADRLLRCGCGVNKQMGQRDCGYVTVTLMTFDK